MSIFTELESNVRGYIRSFPNVFGTAENAHLYDEEGVTYIDFLAGAGTLNYGHNPEPMKKDLIRYLEENGVVHGLDMATSAKRVFMETFRKVILDPRDMPHKLQFTGPTGTNAVEAALKIARKYTGRHTVISFTNGFHGVTAGSLATTANSHYREAMGMPLPGVSFLPYDGYLGEDMDTADYLEKALSDGSSGVDAPAAILLETIQGEGGINVASKEWLQRVQSICREHDILLIIDDIQMGCGRTGRFFSFEEYGLQPDIITLSKSLSGYGLPMSLVLMRPELDCWNPGEHNGTFRGNNAAFVTATTALTTYWADDRFGEEVRAKGEGLRQQLQAIAERHPEIGFTVRGRGMVQAIECPTGDLADDITAECFKHHLIIETSGAEGQVVKCLAPLTIEQEVLDAGVKILGEAVDTVLARRKAERVNDPMMMEESNA